MVGDVTQRAEVERLFADARDALGGRIDGVVDIVGMAQYASLLDTTDELWDWHHDIVLRHAWLAMQRFGRAMAADGGGSWSSSRRCRASPAAPLHAAYGAAKAGLMALVRSAAVELGPRGHPRQRRGAGRGVDAAGLGATSARRATPATPRTRRCAGSRCRPTSPPRCCSSAATSPAT